MTMVKRLKDNDTAIKDSIIDFDYVKFDFVKGVGNIFNNKFDIEFNANYRFVSFTLYSANLNVSDLEYLQGVMKHFKYELIKIMGLNKALEITFYKKR